MVDISSIYDRELDIMPLQGLHGGNQAWGLLSPMVIYSMSSGIFCSLASMQKVKEDGLTF